MEVRQTAAFATWLGSLRDRRAQARIVARLARIELGMLGDAKHFDGLTELRVDYGPGYRIYAAQRGNIMIILLRRRQEFAAARYRQGQSDGLSVGLE